MSRKSAGCFMLRYTQSPRIHSSMVSYLENHCIEHKKPMDSGCCGIILHNSTILVSIGLCQQNNNKKSKTVQVFLRHFFVNQMLWENICKCKKDKFLKKGELLKS